ncbi:MAG: radical SAM protein [Candidatus Cloacimonadota bacterium]|nr:radical SAM protein [Candidatus Cloacimonadota bacterium]
MAYKHLFGPVPSRRLGISLGVDLVPHKVCSLNCVYCEVGATTNLTITRKEYVSSDEVIAELKNFLHNKPNLDYITFSGAGEPTLNSQLGTIIDFIKESYPQYKLSLLTNGTLFYDKVVRKESGKVDIVLPSLDAVRPESFLKINRPNPSLNIEKIIDGLIRFRKENPTTTMWLELFIVQGINDSELEIEQIKQVLTQISPDRIQLNTLDRPGTASWVKAASTQQLLEIKQKLDPLPTEIIAKFKSARKYRSYNQDIEKTILETISRRPCTDKDLCEILGLHINELNKYLQQLQKENKIKSERLERGVFFRTIKNNI